MQLDKSAFYRRYKSLSDDELIQIRCQGDLVREAREALQLVLSERDIGYEASSRISSDDSAELGNVQVNDARFGSRPVGTQQTILQEFSQGNDKRAVRSPGYVRPRHFLWKVYGVLLILGYLSGVCFYVADQCTILVSQSCSYVLASFVGSTSNRVGVGIILLLWCFHALALYGYYCFLRQKPSFSHPFWIIFALFHIVRFSVGLVVLFTSNWKGVPYAWWYWCSFLPYTPLCVAIALYAFGSGSMWKMYRLTSSRVASDEFV